MHDFLPQALTIWITQYGSFALFMLLMLGIFALPVPDEALLIFCGALVASGQLSLVPTYIAAMVGTCCGITLSYLVGRIAGIFLVQKYGYLFRITEAKMQRVHNWFEKFGRWFLCIGYLFPGIRHLTGYAAGISDLEYPRFALFAYSGAVVWSIIFLTLGYFLGYKWIYIVDMWDTHSEEIILVLVVIIVLVLALVGLRRWLKARKTIH